MVPESAHRGRYEYRNNSSQPLHSEKKTGVGRGVRFGSLFYGGLSVTSIYSVDGRVISKL